MELDPRCCGTGTCIINEDGKCWCGQEWDGEKMCFKPLNEPTQKADATSHSPQAQDLKR